MKISLEILATLRGDFGELPGKSTTLRGNARKAGAQVARGLTLISGIAALAEGWRVSTYGGAARPPIKASELRVLEGTYENKSEGLGRAGLAQGLSIKMRGWGLGWPANRSEGFWGYGPRAGQPTLFGKP